MSGFCQARALWAQVCSDSTSELVRVGRGYMQAAENTGALRGTKKAFMYGRYIYIAAPVMASAGLYYRNPYS